jgi:hypothetical protein
VQQAHLSATQYRFLVGSHGNIIGQSVSKPSASVESKIDTQLYNDLYLNVGPIINVHNTGLPFLCRNTAPILAQRTALPMVYFIFFLTLPL